MDRTQKAIAFAIMCGFPLAASTETREGFDLAHPFIFYFFHGILLSLSLVLLVGAYRRDPSSQSPGSEAGL
ncbi:MAG: hypothetical protein Q4B12_09125 [Bowdeniella nasicola]|nr:hypothetical protein [Bowdeniella nasicola]